MFLLEQNTIEKEQVDKTKSQLEFKGNSKGKENELERIWDSMTYVKELKNGQLPGLYYLVLWRGYLKKENT